jgi:hypothetical protein
MEPATWGAVTVLFEDMCFCLGREIEGTSHLGAVTVLFEDM